MTETTSTPKAIASTIATLGAAAASRFPDHVAARFQVDGEWQQMTYAETGQAIEEIGLGLIALGLQPGDRVAVLAPTRVEWTQSAYGISAAGAVLVPVYPTNSARECEWVLGNSGTRAVICSDTEQVAKVESVRAQLPELEHIICIDDASGELTLDELRGRGRDGDRSELAARREAVTGDDLFEIIYTSGTTGPPKGSMITHTNAIAVAEMVEEIGALNGEEVAYLYLPLAHVYAQTVMLAGIDLGIAVIYHGGDTTQIVAEIMATHPTYIPSVPRVFEKLYTVAMKMRAAGTPEDQERFDQAVEVGVAVRQMRERGEEVPAELQAGFERADENLYARVRTLFGDHVTQAVSAAAPIATEILRFFYACGVPVMEGWGMTETTAMGTVGTLEHYRFGTVGRAMPGVELKIADDGEVLIRGRNIFKGYWKNQEATDEVLIDGWLHTGDLGSLDEAGYLSITGRKKEIIITAGGKNLSPANLENDLKQSPFVSQAVMHGDRRPYPIVLITLDPEEIVPWAKERGLPEDISTLARAPEVKELVQGIVDGVNEHYASVEQVKRFAILGRELSIDDGELTPTLKIKRSVVNERYSDVIDDLYGA
jgi:long-chain acyl-CoA synthetase